MTKAEDVEPLTRLYLPRPQAEPNRDPEPWARPVAAIHCRLCGHPGVDVCDRCWCVGGGALPWFDRRTP